MGEGTVLPEGSDGHHDEAGIQLRQPTVAQSAAIQVTRVEGLDEEIGSR